MPLESSIVKRICDRLAREPGCWYMKVHGSALGRRGVPDIIGSMHGKMFGLEVKRPKYGRVAPLQEYELQQIANAGGMAAVVESLEDVCEVLGLAC